MNTFHNRCKRYHAFRSVFLWLRVLLLELLTQVLLGGTLLPHSTPGLERLHLGSDRPRLLAAVRIWDRDDFFEGVLLHVFQFGLRCVPLLDSLLARSLREDQQLGFVQLETLHVGIQTFLAANASAVIDGNADSGCKLFRDLSLFQLLKCEALSKPEPPH